ncbi:MAG TPA: single-stranded DNA-binding protein, partial [Acidobacteriaceae bacterium]|nr:single-stranded DNA-binding protein [Acidobacteriaceae bacterium]
QLVYIEGRIQTRQWEDKRDGQKRTSTDIVASVMRMLGSRGDAAAAGAGPSGGTYAPHSSHDEFDAGPMPDEAPSSGPDITDEDIPF